jgi:hypothetical protein
MKRTPTPKRSRPTAMRSEYRLDYSRGKPNRFAARFGAGTIAITLDPDVAAVFTSSKAVNALLRSVIAAVPTRRSAG